MEKKKVSNYIAIFVGVAVVVWLFYGLVFSQFVPRESSGKDTSAENPASKTGVIGE